MGAVTCAAGTNGTGRPAPRVGRGVSGVGIGVCAQRARATREPAHAAAGSSVGEIEQRPGSAWGMHSVPYGMTAERGILKGKLEAEPYE